MSRIVPGRMAERRSYLCSFQCCYIIQEGDGKSTEGGIVFHVWKALEVIHHFRVNQIPAPPQPTTMHRPTNHLKKCTQNRLHTLLPLGVTGSTSVLCNLQHIEGQSCTSFTVPVRIRWMIAGTHHSGVRVTRTRNQPLTVLPISRISAVSRAHKQIID